MVKFTFLLEVFSLKCLDLQQINANLVNISINLLQRAAFNLLKALGPRIIGPNDYNMIGGLFYQQQAKRDAKQNSRFIQLFLF